eukprot:scaffold31792_cov168-Amphora_coffeaeformis.AAC.4
MKVVASFSTIVLVLTPSPLSVTAFQPTSVRTASPSSVQDNVARHMTTSLSPQGVSDESGSIHFASPPPSPPVIDQDRRNLLNMIVLGSAAVTVGGIAVPYLAFFMPPTDSAGDSANKALVALDAVGREISAEAYLQAKPPGDHSLVQGLKGDATYLIVKEDKSLQSFGLSASK